MKLDGNLTDEAAPFLARNLRHPEPLMPRAEDTSAEGAYSVPAASIHATGTQPLPGRLAHPFTIIRREACRATIPSTDRQIQPGTLRC